MNQPSYALIGYPLVHSFSAAYFENKFKAEHINASFKNIELQSLDALIGILNTDVSIRGFSVTIPHKEKIISYLDELDPLAKSIGAVNCVRVIRHDNGRIDQLVGYNTDAYGFKMSIKPFLAMQHYRALILGTGGASKAIAHSLDELGIEYFWVSRNATMRNQKIIQYADLNATVIASFPFIINASPVGTFPDVDEKPNIPYEGLTSHHFIFDSVYNPAVTAFLQEGIRRNCIAVNGLSMLQLQAEKAWSIWNAGRD